jgi:hypothetical protein
MCLLQCLNGHIPGGQRGQRWRSLAHTPGRSQFRGCCRNGPWGGYQVAYRTRIPPHLDPVGEASNWEPPAEPPAYQTDSPGKQLLPVETTCHRQSSCDLPVKP